MSDLAELVHAPLACWAHERDQAIAIDDGHSPLSFAALHAAVQQAQAALADAPRHLLVDDRQPTAAQLVQFLSIVASD
ncbi:o-succinylbenzoate--CoA ligase, partial [Klebsiella pneumoniae]|nr:o-succinylbenzoate--CoA ligase [Klebsiella pneumoniae]